MSKDLSRMLRMGAIGATAAVVAGFVPGCGGATCEQLARNRADFLARAATDTGTHIEVTVPYAVANGLINPALAKIEPLAVDVPGLGSLASAFGRLRVAPRRVTLQAAHGDRVGLRLDFDVLVGGDDAFGLWVETELEPEIDLSAGRVSLGFSPESLEKVKPHLTADAAQKLGGLVYRNLPGLARALVSRPAIDKAAAGVVELLLERFYAMSKDRLLEELGKLARLSVALPDVPIRSLSLEPTADAKGALRLSISTNLPVAADLAARAPGTPLPADRVSVRASAPAVAELVNWAMGRGLVPSRYNDKGKPDAKGAYLAAVEWIPGDRPMKAHLWKTEGTCMRLDMGADAEVSAKDGKLRIEARDGVIESVEASAFTELGVLFYALWKDAVDVTMSRSAELRFKVAGTALVSRVEQAALVRDELTLTVSLAQRAKCSETSEERQ
jgi:hypothetical protein